MRVASVNLNKGLNGPRRPRFDAWLQNVDPDVLLVQEPVGVGTGPPQALGPLLLVEGNDLVAAYVAPSFRAAAEFLEERWLRVQVDAWTFDDVYLPHESKTGRQTFFERLAQKPARHRLIVGDFNMAPRPKDGTYGDQESTWTGARERTAFSRLLQSGLLDLGESDPHRFTFEKLNRGAWSRFRCDLALLSKGERTEAVYTSDPGVREAASGFTDHSAIIVDLGA